KTSLGSIGCLDWSNERVLRDFHDGDLEDIAPRVTGSQDIKRQGSLDHVFNDAIMDKK
ncbi:hypothetical protein KI387_043126, partial [Taxus chinensis]